MRRTDKSQPTATPEARDSIALEPDFRQLFESVPDPCLVLDRNLRIVAVNDAYLRATMTTRGQLTGHVIFDIFPDSPSHPNPTGVRNLTSSLKRVLNNRVIDVMDVQRYDIPSSRQGGGFEERYWSIINKPVMGPDNEVAFIIHRVQDITGFVLFKQKRIPEATEDMWLWAVQIEAEGFARSEEVTEINLLLKRANEELETRNKELLELNLRLEGEVAARRQFQDALHAANVDLERSKNELEASLLQLQAILENIYEGVIISDLNGNILAMNDAARALHQYPSTEEVRRHMSQYRENFELFDLEGQEVPLTQWPLARVLRGERFADTQILLRHKDTGKEIIVSYDGTPVFNKAGEAILAVLTVRDITQRKRMEEQIVNLNAKLSGRVSELEEANEDLEAFNRMASHDLRQPLNTIAVSCQMIQMMCGEKLGPECNDFVRISYNKVLAMNDLIDSFLKFSRSTQGELHREDVDLSEIAKSVVADVTLSEPERRATFRIAQGVTANADPDLVRSVLENLIGNAWKYTGMKPEVIIEFGAKEIDGEQAYFVRDNGKGFNTADAANIFTPFSRLSGSEKFQGFGIGLATVDRIIRRHGGRIWAEGEPDRGATFYFTLPASKVVDRHA